MESKQVGNRSIWSEGRVETRSAGWDRRVCRVKSVERNYAIFPTGRIVRSSRLRLKISRVSPILDLFKNRLSILARETCRSEKVFLRESGREEKREAWFQAVPSRFSKVLRENIPSNEEGDDATISRTSRSKALTRSSFFPFLRSFDCRIKKRKKERTKKKERGEIQR